ncbi:DnaJ-class molecular chaperone [Salirhabdus euzebyi]|uniref:DnaJ-class molecular chaperone n=1 Tax=Salirhabdus euzebyi TaxID=394506 RepID=A0A841Q4S3_9BACI|nr:methionine aminopeptidase [Salirhabdus euzebyi]MBB6453350.1 DnaJ-class molecular chaperone [Salirhabdus euzebyi]
MGFLSSVNEWRENRREKKLSEMESLGICPDCAGKGFHHITHSEMYYAAPFECQGCNGSGSYAEWSSNNMF